MPSAIEGTACSGDEMPIRIAASTTFSGPTSLASSAATVLRDSASAVRSVISPPNLPSEFSGCQPLMSIGPSVATVSGV